MKLSLVPWSEMSIRNKVILICSTTLLVLIGFYLLICKPKAQAVEALQGRLEQQRVVLRDTQRELRDIPDPEGYQQQLHEQEALVKSLLPDSEAITDLLVVLNALGKEQRVKIVGVRQNAYTDRKTYYEIPLEITVSGTYPDLLYFINKMEGLRRFNSISKIGAQADENFVTMQLSAVVYVYGTMPPNVQTKSSKL
jgi:type IV pilus assembly protein PilO